MEITIKRKHKHEQKKRKILINSLEMLDFININEDCKNNNKKYY